MIKERKVEKYHNYKNNSSGISKHNDFYDNEKYNEDNNGRDWFINDGICTEEEENYIAVEPADNDKQSPYKLVGRDVFPVAHYITKKTGEYITHDFTMEDEYYIEQLELYKIIDEFGLKKIYDSMIYYSQKKYFYGHVIYEFFDQNKNELVLFTINSYEKYLDRSAKNIKKENKNKIGSNSIWLYSNRSCEIFNKLIERVTIHLKKIRETKDKNMIRLVIQKRDGYDTTRFELPKQAINIEHNYGKNFKEINSKIINKLNEKDGKGLVLLHGTPGTGKTHYLKYLASKIKDKKVLFIPPYLVDFITSPNMTPFLIDNSNSILFIEDAEKVITDREMNGSSVGVSNILNLTDGILSDILKIQVVATFNMDKAKIDPALLRKGRLIAEHRFDALSVDDSNNLLKHLEKDYRTNKPMTLTEIYNIDEKEYKSENKKTTIGFNQRY